MWIISLVTQSLTRRRRTNAALLVAFLGIAIGVMSLLSVMGIMNGLQRVLTDTLVAVDSYEYRSSPKGSLSLDEIASLSRSVSSIEGITATVPYVDEFAIARIRNNSAILRIRAIDGEAALRDDEFISALRHDEHRDENRSSFIPQGGIVIGWIFALSHNIYPGDIISLILPGEGDGFRPVTLDLVVTSYFSTYSRYDAHLGFISLEDYLLSIPQKKISNLSIGTRFEKKKRSSALKTLSSLLPRTISWKTDNKSFAVALATEKITLLLLSAMIFGIILLHFRFAMLRRIRGKTEDIVALRTMGASPRAIHLWFFGEAIVVGTLGMLVGLSFGLAFVHLYAPILEKVGPSWGLSIEGIINFGKGHVSYKEVGGVIVFASLVISTTSWFAARRALHVTPMQMIRYE